MPDASGTRRPLVTFEGVEKTYDGHTLAVRNLNLQVAQGEFLTLLGPSGSGKTTTLNMLAGFERPTRGRIVLDGMSVDRRPPYERNIGMVFQNYALFPHMTVAENVAFPLTVRRFGRSEIAARVTRALAMVRLEPFASRRPAQLSGGQQQRVALARALVFEPSLVLMDEPLGALDKKLREHMQIEIKRLHETLGLTVVYVTHDQSEALTMSDRVAVFCDGAVVQQGPPELLYTAPETAFVAGFIGENNLLPGTLTAIGAELAGGAFVPATPIGPLRSGDAVCLAVRPECIRIVAADDMVLRGRIESRIYLGDHQRVLVRLPGGELVGVKLDPQARTDGADVALSWSAGDCRAFPAESVPEAARSMEWGMA